MLPGPIPFATTRFTPFRDTCLIFFATPISFLFTVFNLGHFTTVILPPDIKELWNTWSFSIHNWFTYNALPLYSLPTKFPSCQCVLYGHLSNYSWNLISFLRRLPKLIRREILCFEQTTPTQPPKYPFFLCTVQHTSFSHLLLSVIVSAKTSGQSACLNCELLQHSNHPCLERGHVKVRRRKWVFDFSTASSNLGRGATLEGSQAPAWWPEGYFAFSILPTGNQAQGVIPRNA